MTIPGQGDTVYPCPFLPELPESSFPVSHRDTSLLVFSRSEKGAVFLFHPLAIFNAPSSQSSVLSRRPVAFSGHLYSRLLATLAVISPPSVLTSVAIIF